MLISEIFYSLQGEGELAGVPSVFIRTAGCNLRCAWCDTPYASWNPEGTEWRVDDLVDEVRKHPARHVVLTGGEPMLARDIFPLAAALRQSGHHITIETAGTLSPGGIACDLASVSPKFANSTPAEDRIGEEWLRRHEATRWRPEVLREWAGGYAFQMKLVVAHREEAEDCIARLRAVLPELPASKILLMPEGTDADTLRSRTWLIDFCLKHGYRFCDRLHIHLFGNTRGT